MARSLSSSIKTGSISFQPFETGVCPACTFAKLNRTLFSIRKQRKDGPVRRAGTLASSTAVNAGKDVPSAFKELHTALEKLNKVAPSYVNISRLQLALRGLESTRPVTRVAVLSLQHEKLARQVTRLLIADALTAEGAWEKELEHGGQDDGRGLLLRFREEDDPSPLDPLLRTVHVPSRILWRLNLEIIVSSLSSATTTEDAPANFEQLKRTALVPTAETPKSFRGAVSFVTYPVHRALVLAEGLKGCLMLGRYKNDREEKRNSMASSLKTALNVPVIRGYNEDDMTVGTIHLLNTPQAISALDQFRASNANATFYEQNWNASGMPALTEWLSFGSEETTDELKPAIKELIEDILREASRNVQREDLMRMQALPMSTEPLRTQQPLDGALTVWAMRAHTELLDRLDIAFGGGNWAKLRWWKLFWRVDDVSMIVTEVVERSWLIEAERGMIWLAGRATEAGYLESDEFLSMKPLPRPERSTNTNVQVLATESSSVIDDGAVVAKSVATGETWPTRIPAVRAMLQATGSLNLQSLGQALLLQGLSITSLSTVLSALIYVSFPTTSVYEAGAVAVFGLVWSLRRLQKNWECARTAWMAEVREMGRITLKEVEEGFRKVLGREVEVPEVEGAADRRLAKEVVEECRTVLKAMGGKASK